MNNYWNNYKIINQFLNTSIYKNLNKVIIYKLKNIVNVFITDKLLKIKDKIKELCYTQMEDYIKVNGKIISKKEKDIKYLPIILFIMDLILKVNHMDMESINGKMDKYIKVNG